MNWDILNISNHPFHNMHMYCIVSFYFLHIFLSLWYLRSYAPVLDHLSMLLRREGLPFIRGLILNLPKYSWARVIKIYPQQHIFYRELKQLPSRLGGFFYLSHLPICATDSFLILTGCQLLTDPQCFPRFIICNSGKHSSLGLLCHKQCFYQNLRNSDNKSHW